MSWVKNFVSASLGLAINLKCQFFFGWNVLREPLNNPQYFVFSVKWKDKYIPLPVAQFLKCQCEKYPFLLKFHSRLVNNKAPSQSPAEQSAVTVSFVTALRMCQMWKVPLWVQMLPGHVRTTKSNQCITKMKVQPQPSSSRMDSKIVGVTGLFDPTLEEYRSKRAIWVTVINTHRKHIHVWKLWGTEDFSNWSRCGRLMTDYSLWPVRTQTSSKRRKTSKWPLASSPSNSLGWSYLAFHCRN